MNRKTEFNDFYADLKESAPKELVDLRREAYREARALLERLPRNKARALLRALVDKIEFDKTLKDMYVWQRVAAVKAGINEALK